MCAIAGWFSEASVCASRVNRSEPFGVACKCVRQDFQGDVAIQSRVAGAIHLPHAALADMRNDLVDAEPRSGCEGQMS